MMELIYIILLLSIPVYIILLRIMYKKKMYDNKKRWLIAFIPTAILTPALVCGSILLFLFIIAYSPNKKFVKEKWDTDLEKRYMFSENIIKKERLIGKTTEEVFRLLGYKEQYTIENDTVYQVVYFLGEKGGLMVINYHYLDIFIKNGKVVQVDHNADYGSKYDYLKEKIEIDSTNE